MKIVLVTSSPQKKGNSAVLARQALRAAEDLGALTKEIYLPEKRIETCRGCFTCTSKGYCPIQDDCSALKEELYTSDGIILSSPSYGFEPCSEIRKFNVERMGMLDTYTSAYGGKYFLGFSTAGGIGSQKVAKKLAFSQGHDVFSRSYVSGYLGVIRSTKKQGVRRIEECEKELKKAYDLGKKLVRDIAKKRRFPLQRLKKRIFSFLVLRPIMRGNVWRNREESMNAVHQRLMARGWM